MRKEFTTKNMTFTLAQEGGVTLNGMAPCRWRAHQFGNHLESYYDGKWQDDRFSSAAYDDACKEALRALVGPPPWERSPMTTTPAQSPSEARKARIEELGARLCALSDESEGGFSELRAITIALIEERDALARKAETDQESLRLLRSDFSEVVKRLNSKRTECDLLYNRIRHLSEGATVERNVCRPPTDDDRLVALASGSGLSDEALQTLRDDCEEADLEGRIKNLETQWAGAGMPSCRGMWIQHEDRLAAIERRLDGLATIERRLDGLNDAIKSHAEWHLAR